MTTKITIIGVTAAVGFKTAEEMSDWLCANDIDAIFYRDSICSVSTETLKRILPVSPEYLTYWEENLCILWGGKLRKNDSEHPYVAFKSYFDKDVEYVVMWKPLGVLS